MHMKIRNALVAAAGLAGAASIAAAGSASAATTSNHTPAPKTYTAVTQLPQRGDSGQSSTWAIDHDTRVLVIKQQPSAIPGTFNYTATVTDRGSFTTNTNVLAPNQNAPYTGVKTGTRHIDGTVDGQASYTFSTNAQVSNKRNLGLPASENDHGQYVSSGDTSTSDWFMQAFPAGATVGGGITSWKWTYDASHVLTGYKTVTTYQKVFTGWKMETVYVKGHKTHKWVAQYKYVKHTHKVGQYKNEQYVDAANGETGEIAGL
jgi:hypothetical protein